MKRKLKSIIKIGKKSIKGFIKEKIIKSKPEVESDVFHSFNEIKSENWKKWESQHSEEYKKYREEWVKYPKELKVAPHPLHLDIEVSSRCNLKCPFCSRTQRLEQGNWRKPGDIKIDLYKEVIDQAVENNVYALNLNVIGEPFLNKNFLEMVKYAKDKGILDVFFHTNAVLLNEKKSRELISSGLDKLIISFDSPYKEKYERVRVGAKYEQVLNNVKRFKRIRDEMGSITPVTRINFIKLPGVTKQEIEDMVTLFEPLVDSIGLLDYIESDNEVRVKADYPKDYKSKFVCSQLLTRMVVYDDGRVFPCCSDYDDGLEIGDIKNETLAEIWQGDRLNEIRKKHFEGKFFELDACAKCDYALQADGFENREIAEEY